MKSDETSAAFTDAQAKSLAVVQSYFESMQNADINTVDGMFTDDAVEVIPLEP